MEACRTESERGQVSIEEGRTLNKNLFDIFRPYLALARLQQFAVLALWCKRLCGRSISGELHSDMWWKSGSRKGGEIIAPYILFRC
jgi:hypothetical protein